MGYYADLIKEKRNSKYSYKLIDKGYYGVRKEEEYHKWVVQTWYGTKLVDEQEVTGPQSKAEAQGQKNVAAFERRYPENAKEEKDNAGVVDKFSYKGALITIIEKGAGKYTYSITQDGREEGTNATYPTQDKAESEAKREVEVNWNEKEEGYYAKLAKEKKNSNAYLIALSLLKGNTPVRECVRELTDNYHFSKDEAYKALDKAAKDLHDADIEEMVRQYYK